MRQAPVPERPSVWVMSTATPGPWIGHPLGVLGWTRVDACTRAAALALGQVGVRRLQSGPAGLAALVPLDRVPGLQGQRAAADQAPAGRCGGDSDALDLRARERSVRVRDEDAAVRRVRESEQRP